MARGARLFSRSVVGAFTGVASAHLMFGMSLFSASTHARHGAAQLLSESVATFGLLFVIWGCAHFRPSGTAYAVGAYITAAYWFTASTSFANPAVTLGRSTSNTFAGIRPSDMLPFIIAQLAGGLAATLLFRWLETQTVSNERTPADFEHTAADPVPR